MQDGKIALATSAEDRQSWKIRAGLLEAIWIMQTLIQWAERQRHYKKVIQFFIDLFCGNDKNLFDLRDILVTVQRRIVGVKRAAACASYLALRGRERSDY